MSQSMACQPCRCCRCCLHPSTQASSPRTGLRACLGAHDKTSASLIVVVAGRELVASEGRLTMSLEKENLLRAPRPRQCASPLLHSVDQRRWLARQNTSSLLLVLLLRIPRASRLREKVSSPAGWQHNPDRKRPKGVAGAAVCPSAD